MELSSAVEKDVDALNIEIETENCEECTTTFSFYVISDSNLSHSPCHNPILGYSSKIIFLNNNKK